MFTVGIITSSDKGYRGEREDKSGQVIEEIVSQNGFKVIKKVVLPDEKDLLEKEMINMCDNLNVNLLLTTGGTGFSKRDITPEDFIVYKLQKELCYQEQPQELDKIH